MHENHLKQAITSLARLRDQHITFLLSKDKLKPEFIENHHLAIVKLQSLNMIRLVKDSFLCGFAKSFSIKIMKRLHNDTKDTLKQIKFRLINFL